MTELTLGIDTSTARLTVATLSMSGTRELAAGELNGPQAHGERLAELIREVLAGQRPTRIAVGLGPGPYTGLRVGIVTAEMLGEAWSVPVVGVSTLEALANGYRRRTERGECVAVLDVKRREIAWQHFSALGAPLGDPKLASINALHELPAGVPLVGPAFESQRLVQPAVADAAPVSAVDIALLAVLGSDRLEPLYLRQPDAAEPAPRKQVRND